jgi:6,7-dimethyl-8-ribityllumazine synthase
MKKNSATDLSALPSAATMRFGIVVAEWNNEVTEKLFEGASKTLLDSGAKKENIIRKNVPGSFELIAGAKFFAEYKKPDAVICLGCVIQGETRHFEFICNAVSQGLIDLTLQHNIPFIFGVLTTNDETQALERAGGTFGNKGVEAAATAIKMVALQNEMKK